MYIKSIFFKKLNYKPYLLLLTYKKQMKKIFCIYLFCFTIPLCVNAQYITADSTYLVGAKIIDGDTLPNVYIKTIKVFPKKEFKNRRAYLKYTRLVHNVKKAYPFAIIARNELKIMNDSLMFIDGERDRRKFIRYYEKQMFKKYESQLRHLTISQGRILIKLVYREIGNTSYALVKEYRGGFSAVFWQGIARLFGSNLKKSYNPKGEDAEIEEIVTLIEEGLI